MAESQQKSRPKSPFSHIKDSIMSTKNKYKPLESQEGWSDTKDEPAKLRNVSEITQDGSATAQGGSAKEKKSSAATKKTQEAKKTSMEAIKKWDGWVPVKEDTETMNEVQAGVNNGSVTTKDGTVTAKETTKKGSGSAKKNSKKGSVATMVGSVASVVGSVVTRDASMSTRKCQVATLDGLDDANENSDAVEYIQETTKESLKAGKNNHGARKTSLPTKIGSMVTKHKEKCLVSKDSTVMKFKMCPVSDHDQFLSLFCKTKKCQKAICPLCLIESHKDHDVCDLAKAEKKNKESLTSTLETTTKTYKTLNAKLTNAKQTITDSTRNAKESLEARREAVMKMFDKLSQEMVDQRVETIQDIDKKISILEDNTALLTSISENARDLKNHEEIVSKLRIVQDMKENTDAILRKTRICTHYEYKDSKITLEELNRICGGLKRAETSLDLQPQPDVPLIVVDKVAKSFQTRYEYINGVQVLTDGNIVVYGTDYADWQYRLTLYTSQVTVAGSALLKEEPWGLAEITLGGKRCLAVSYPESGKITFHDLKHLTMVVHNLRAGPHQPRCMCALDTNTLLYEDNSVNPLEIRWLDCRKAAPHYVKKGDSTIQTHQSWTSDMCCALAPGNKKLLVTTHYSMGIYAYNTANGKVEWKISGKLDNMKKDIRPWGVTTDGRTGMFVCDINNDCILLVSVQGQYLGTVLRAGECDLGAPWRLGWCRPTGSLIVQDVKDEESCISVVKLKKRT